MVRLVFRPYTQIRRSICTSESLRASTRVSSGFTLFRHSSPSFGSQHTCSTADPSSKTQHVNVGRGPEPSRGRAEFLSPNHRMRPKAITHSEECHIPSTLVRRPKLMLTRRAGSTPSEKQG
ncbi:hypothetical protein PAXINDRAFT_177522 [Paxillus involutus ATCC 200175]|uniref:Uncharacterized protein n=1 Tax=Paxillus involutus ATCC 200175 TaxID=664439 RepID=A0A0C9SQL4_PAXIN|nr:hypothetical protein PAXINDRAFT_177522 [Paxillus involutus ATCC 200175]